MIDSDFGTNYNLVKYMRVGHTSRVISLKIGTTISTTLFLFTNR